MYFNLGSYNRNISAGLLNNWDDEATQNLKLQKSVILCDLVTFVYLPITHFCR